MAKVVLVTGGAGFIGFHLIQQLLNAGMNVVCVDDLNTYYDPTLKHDRLKRLEDRVDFFRIDITERSAFEKLFEAYDFSSICHLAAQAGVRYSLEHPDVYINTNYVGTFNVLELAKKYGVKNLLIASTSSVYGESDNLPFTEDDVADRPCSLYAATKRAAEIMGYNYHALYGMNITFLRFFTVYGPWGRPDMALFRFTENILANKPIDIYNKGDMYRDFTYVDDIVAGFMAALRFLERSGGFQIYNLGRGSSVSLMTFISLLERTLKKKAIKNYMPMQPGDVYKTWADISKAQHVLDYQPKVDIEEGLKKFVNWYQNYYGA